MSRVSIICKGGKTKKSMQKECDINYLIERYQKKGIIPPIKNKPALYGDFSTVEDFQKSLSVVEKASEQFDGLSPEIKKRFHFDPSEFLKFCTDVKNQEELIKLGLATRKEDPVIVKPTEEIKKEEIK